MNNRCIHKKIQDNLYATNAVNIKVCLPGGFSYGDYYDPVRKTGSAQKAQNPIWVKGIPETLSANSLVFKNFGLTETGAISVTVKNCDVDILKQAKCIFIEEKEYHVYLDACGNRFQSFPLAYGYTKVILFRKEH